jgi:hypothetical protein
MIDRYEAWRREREKQAVIRQYTRFRKALISDCEFAGVSVEALDLEMALEMASAQIEDAFAQQEKQRR